jgi:cytochrome P450
MTWLYFVFVQLVFVFVGQTLAMGKGALKGMGPGGVYIPFGAGPRVCIGTGFAMMEAVLLLSTVTRGVELRLKPGAKPPAPRALITLRPDRVELDVVPRARTSGGMRR